MPPELPQLLGVPDLLLLGEQHYLLSTGSLRIQLLFLAKAPFFRSWRQTAGRIRNQGLRKPIPMKKHGLSQKLEAS